MFFDIDALDAARSYKLATGTIVPRPIAWVVTADAEGQPNAAPFSFFNCFGGHPPVVGIGIGARRGARKDTLANIVGRGELVVNLVSDALAEAMNVTAVDFPAGWDELATAGLDTVPCDRVALPRIVQSPVALECRLWQTIALPPDSTLVLAQVIGVHIADAAVLNAERCHVDSAKLQLIGRMQSPGGYTRTHEGFSMKMMDFEQWRQQRN